MKDLIEWKDKSTGKEMYDYRTGTFKDIEDVFSTKTTGVSFYNELLPDSSEADYYRKEMNLEGEIQYLTPQQYFEICAEYIFPNSSVDRLKKGRSLDTQSVDTIKTVIDNNVRLPMTYIDYARHTQEGLHRMYVLGELYGWDDIKYPVLVIDWYDSEYQNNIDNQRRIDEIENDIKKAVLDACDYNYSSFDEFVEELQWTINDSFKNYDEFEDVEDVPFKIWEEDNHVNVEVLDVPFIFNISDINIKDDLDIEEIDLGDLDIEDFNLDDMDISAILKKLK